MRINYMLFICLFLLISAGCANENNTKGNNQQNEPSGQPINYETPQEQKNRLGIREESIGEQGGYPQSEQKGLNAGSGKYTDLFTNDESVRIAEHLTEHREIKQAQVASTEDRIIVGVLLNDNSDHDITEMIKEEVRKIESDKQIIIYTDDKHLDRMRNLNAKLKPANMGNELEKLIEDFLNPGK